MADPGLVSIVGVVLTGAAMVGAALVGAVAGVVSTAAALARVLWTASGVRARRGGTVAAAVAGGRVADARVASGCVAFTAASGLRVRCAAVAALRDGPAVTARARRAGAFGRPTAGGRVLVVSVGAEKHDGVLVRVRASAESAGVSKHIRFMAETITTYRRYQTVMSMTKEPA
jgi:hypothetical protein